MVRRNLTLSAVQGTKMRVPRLSKLEQVCVCVRARACRAVYLHVKFPAAICQIK